MLPIYFHWEFLVQEIMHILTERGGKWQVGQNVNNWWICVKDVGEIVTLFLQFEIKSSENLTKKSYPPPQPNPPFQYVQHFRADQMKVPLSVLKY